MVGSINCWEVLEWLHNWQLLMKGSALSISCIGGMGSARSTNGEKRNAYRILVGKPEGKRPLGRPRRMWVDNIKIDLREVG
jgi:hypothetical protein